MIMDFISLKCLALNLSLPITYLKRLVAAGKIPYIDTGGGRKRFQEAAVRVALSKLEQESVKLKRETVLAL